MNRIHNDRSKTPKLIPLQDNEPKVRKRNNSLIPVEFMMNTTGEAGRECAALATVFGVPEYIDSKSFWDRQQQQEKSTKVGDNKYGYVAVSTVSVMSRPLAKPVEEVAQSHAFPSYIDAVLDPIAAFSPSLEPTPQASKSFSLPKIPAVSKFNDVIPDSPITLELPTLTVPISRSQSCSTTGSDIKDVNQDALILSPSEIFDFITTDEDERFIIWGPDPIALSSSLATATSLTLDRPSSYATLYNSQYERPGFESFSSNTTTTHLNSSQSTLSSKSSRFTSIRLSDLKRPLRHPFSGSSQKDTERNNNTSSFLLKKAFGLKKAKVDTPIVPTTTVDIPKVIEAATIHKLIEKLTSTLDYTFMTDFFLTYRDFIQAQALCQLLVSRFVWSLQNNDEARRIVRIRTFVILRHWLSNYFVHDFLGNYELRTILTDFLNDLSRHPVIKASPFDQRIVKTLKRVVRRLKKIYYTRSSGFSRVKIIAPPPPTAEQEEMGERVRAKLAQNSILRKTTRHVDMSGDHHGNMAVQDTRFAPVVVVGSLHMKGSLADSECQTKTARPASSQFSAPSEDQKVESIQDDVASKVSHDSLESDISAGQTIPDEDDEEDEEEDQSNIQGSFIGSNEHDEHWLREQEETMEYFNALSRQNNFNSPESTPQVPRRISLDRHDSKQEAPQTLPDEWIDTEKGTVGLSRKLSRKSIERRKSERSFQDVTIPAYSNGDVPDMPSLKAEVFDGTIPVAKKYDPMGSFAAVAYEQTEDLSTQNTFESPKSKKPQKISKAISKVFKQVPSNEIEAGKEEIPSIEKNVPIKTESPDKVHVGSLVQEQRKSRFVSLIAEQLRDNMSRDEIHTDCSCIQCTGRKDATTACKQISPVFITDEDRRHSFELRRRRGASIDYSQAPSSQVHDTAQRARPKSRTLKDGPVYLGQLDAKSIIDPCASQTTRHREYREDSEDDEQSTSSSVLASEKSMQTDAQAGSVHPQETFVSDCQANDTDRHHSASEEEEEIDEVNSVPRYITSESNTGKSFIMSHRTSKIVSQLCYIERDVLIKVGWEELIHCRWTKMDANGKININYGGSRDDMLMEDDMAHISYTRQLEKRRAEGKGIEHVIQRFNLVCSWVSSEIVKTKGLHDRVKLIEKFIRVAMKCKLYSNYATLVQILLGLQSPAVARLDKTWSKVGIKYQKQLNKLTEFTSPMKNWKHIRDSMTEVAEEYGNSPSEVQVEMPGTTADKQKSKKTRIKIPFGGCIPFLGIYLSDLVFNSEKPRHLKPNLENQRIYSANTARNIPACLDQPLVNFRKYRVIATVIKRVLIFQGLATRYAFDEDSYLKDRCRHLEILDPATIRELSAQIQ